MAMRSSPDWVPGGAAKAGGGASAAAGGGGATHHGTSASPAAGDHGPPPVPPPPPPPPPVPPPAAGHHQDDWEEWHPSPGASSSGDHVHGSTDPFQEIMRQFHEFVARHQQWNNSGNVVIVECSDSTDLAKQTPRPDDPRQVKRLAQALAAEARIKRMRSDQAQDGLHPAAQPPQDVPAEVPPHNGQGGADQHVPPELPPLVMPGDADPADPRPPAQRRRMSVKQPPPRK